MDPFCFNNADPPPQAVLQKQEEEKRMAQEASAAEPSSEAEPDDDLQGTPFYFKCLFRQVFYFFGGGGGLFQNYPVSPLPSLKFTNRVSYFVFADHIDQTLVEDEDAVDLTAEEQSFRASHARNMADLEKKQEEEVSPLLYLGLSSCPKTLFVNPLLRNLVFFGTERKPWLY